MPPRKKQKTEPDEEKKPPGNGMSPKKTTTPAKSPAVGKSPKTRSKSPAAPKPPPGVTTRNGASTAPPEEACTDPEKVMKANRALRREAEERNAASLAELRELNAALEAEVERTAAALAQARKLNAVLIAEARQRNAVLSLAEAVDDGDQEEDVPLSKLKLGKRKKPENSGVNGTAKKADVDGKTKSDAAAKSTTNGDAIKKAVDVDGKANSDAAAKSWSISADVTKKTETEEEKAAVKEAEALAEAKRLSKGKMKMIEDSSLSPAMVHLDWTSVTDFTPQLPAIDKAVAAEALRLSQGKCDAVDWPALYGLIPQMTDIDKAANEAAAKRLSNSKSKMTSNDLIQVKKQGKKNTSGTKIIMIRYCNASGPLFVKKAEELKTAITALGWKAVFDTIVAKGKFEVREAGGGESVVCYVNLSPPYDALRKLEPATVIPLLVDYFFNE